MGRWAVYRNVGSNLRRADNRQSFCTRAGAEKNAIERNLKQGKNVYYADKISRAEPKPTKHRRKKWGKKG
jgi:hypothetical protein